MAKIANATLTHSREHLRVIPHLHLTSSYIANILALGVQDAAYLTPPHHPGTAPETTTTSSSSNSSLAPSFNDLSRSSISSQEPTGYFSVGINNGNSNGSSYNRERFSITVGHALKMPANWHGTSSEKLIRVLGTFSGTVHPLSVIKKYLCCLQPCSGRLERRVNGSMRGLGFENMRTGRKANNECCFLHHTLYLSRSLVFCFASLPSSLIPFPHSFPLPPSLFPIRLTTFYPYLSFATSAQFRFMNPPFVLSTDQESVLVRLSMWLSAPI